jgi:hypothetical protein
MNLTLLSSLRRYLPQSKVQISRLEAKKLAELIKDNSKIASLYAGLIAAEWDCIHKYKPQYVLIEIVPDVMPKP